MTIKNILFISIVTTGVLVTACGFVNTGANNYDKDFENFEESRLENPASGTEQDSTALPSENDKAIPSEDEQDMPGES